LQNCASQAARACQKLQSAASASHGCNQSSAISLAAKKGRAQMLQDLFGSEQNFDSKRRVKRSLAGKRILVVDDNAINLDVAAESLLGCGAEIDTASGGIAALRSIERMAFDLILLDLSMPDLDGIAVGKAIRSSGLNANVAVLLFTAADNEEAQHAQKEIAAVGLISKPVDIDHLIHMAFLHANALQQ
jgi:CheY-like chemotaxis protein